MKRYSVKLLFRTGSAINIPHVDQDNAAALLESISKGGIMEVGNMNDSPDLDEYMAIRTDDISLAIAKLESDE